MDNRHRWDELLAEINNEKSPARQRQQEIEELENEQSRDAFRDYVQEVAVQLSEDPDSNGRVIPREVAERAFRDYPRNAAELVDHVEDDLLERIQRTYEEISMQGFAPDTILVSPETAEMMLEHNEQAAISARHRPDFAPIQGPTYEEYSRVNAPADMETVRVGPDIGPTEVASGVIRLYGARIMHAFGVSVDDFVSGMQMTAAPASGVMFWHDYNSGRIPNEISLRSGKWRSPENFEEASGYDVIGEHRAFDVLSDDGDDFVAVASG